MKNEEVQIQVNSKAILSRVDRMFDASTKSILLELWQNARRAGATKIITKIQGDTLTIFNDGNPIQDMQDLFSLGESGWKDELIQSEDPAGSGFFICSLFDEVNISTIRDDVRYDLTTGKDALMDIGTTIPVKTTKTDLLLPYETVTAISLKGDKVLNMTETHMKDAAKYFNVPITLIKESQDKKEDYIIEHTQIYTQLQVSDLIRKLGTYNGVDFYLDKSRLTVEYGRASQANFHGHTFNITEHASALDKITSSNYSPYYNIPLIYMNVTGKSDLRMVLPARHSVVQNEALLQLVEDYYKAIGESLKKYGHYYSDFEDDSDRRVILPSKNPLDFVWEAHDLPYYLYVAVRKYHPDLPEAEIPTCIKPFFAQDYEEGEYYLTKQSIDEVFQIALDNVNITTNASLRLDWYEGYKFMKKVQYLTQEDISISGVRVGGEIINEIDIQEGLENIVDSDFEKLTIKVKEHVHDIDYIIRAANGFRGEYTEGISVSVCSQYIDKITPDNFINIILEDIENRWEAAYDDDNGSEEAQWRYFANELQECFTAELVSSNQARVLGKVNAMDSIRWQLGGSSVRAILGNDTEVTIIKPNTEDCYSIELSEEEKVKEEVPTHLSKEEMLRDIYRRGGEGAFMYLYQLFTQNIVEPTTDDTYEIIRTEVL